MTHIDINLTSLAMKWSAKPMGPMEKWQTGHLIFADETAILILGYSLCQKLEDGSPSVMLSHHLISFCKWWPPYWQFTVLQKHILRAHKVQWNTPLLVLKQISKTGLVAPWNSICNLIRSSKSHLSTMALAPHRWHDATNHPPSSSIKHTNR